MAEGKGGGKYSKRGVVNYIQQHVVDKYFFLLGLISAVCVTSCGRGENRRSKNDLEKER
jgi:hypothetical protein